MTIFNDILKRYPELAYETILLGAEDQYATFYLKKDNNELLNELNTGLKNVKEDSRFDQMIAEYL